MKKRRKRKRRQQPKVTVHAIKTKRIREIERTD
jgi:hypothetical protein